MSNLDRDISAEDVKIQKLVDNLSKDKFLIPTFQREFVWEPSNIIKLWDSMFRFYPIGSILYWETDSYLHTHRQLGGFEFPHDEDTVRKFKDWKYILDGQQRATSLLVSMRGGTGRVESDEQFDYSLYFDATKGEFFFAGELAQRKKHIPEEFLIRVRDVPSWSFDFYKEVSAIDGFSQEVEDNLQQLSRMFTDYKISLIRIKGVEVNEVCEIFERINQEGKKLDPVDIIVARTYRREDLATATPGFYLRDNLEGLKSILVEKGSRFQELEDLTLIQMFAICMRKEHTGRRSPFGITPAGLGNLSTEHFESNWNACQRTILDTIKFLADLRIQGPSMLAFGYLAFPICYHLHGNKSPNHHLARQWFWRTALGLDAFRQSSEVYRYCEEFFEPLEHGETPGVPPLEISRSRLVQTSYNYRNALSRAVLAFLATQNPRDFTDIRAEVLDNVYLNLSQTPNLHHIYPQNFLKETNGLPDDAGVDSLMNICFLRARTNIEIGDRNPLTYFDEFARQVRDFDSILESHLIRKDYVERTDFKPQDYRDFLFARADWFIERLRDELPDVAVSVLD